MSFKSMIANKTELKIVRYILQQQHLLQFNQRGYINSHEHEY